MKFTAVRSKFCQDKFVQEKILKQWALQPSFDMNA